MLGARQVHGVRRMRATARNNKTITQFYRTYEIDPGPRACLLEQGIVCMGIATRDGCGALCPQVNMPCTGCYGPPEGVRDQGAKMVSALGSVLDFGELQGTSEEQIAGKTDAAIERPARPGRNLLQVQPCGLAAGGQSAMKRITINPITRLEGHGKIEIFLDEEGNVANTYFQVPELRGFEQFCVGRQAEDMPVITSRICGVCPEAHHMASVKALDRLFRGGAAARREEDPRTALHGILTSPTTPRISTPWAGRISSSGPMRRRRSATFWAWSARWAWTSASR